MRLALFHPVAANLPCNECRRWFYNIQTGERRMRGGRPEPRPANSKIPLPCWECPKESPEQEHEHVLSDKNRQAFDFYLMVKHTAGNYLRSLIETDAIVAHNQVIIGQFDEARQVIDLGRMLRPAPNGTAEGKR